jgi:Leucine-rich repeat (LRR) protein
MFAGLTPAASMSCLTSLDIYNSPVLLSAGELGLDGYLAGLTSLRCLQLSGIASVESLGAVGALTLLTSLSISEAEGLTGLPSFEQLGLLQQLLLRGCSKVKVLSGVQGLTTLQHLTLQDMMSLESLPAELGGLGSLRELVVYFCPCVRKFPASLLQLQLQLLSIGSLNERCPVARQLVESAKQHDAFRFQNVLII